MKLIVSGKGGVAGHFMAERGLDLPLRAWQSLKHCLRLAKLYLGGRHDG